MDLRSYLRILQRQWLVVVICVVLGAGAAALVVARTTPLYASTVRLFVSTPTSDATAQAYQGGLFSQQRVTAYADLIKGSTVAQRVIEKLDLKTSPTALVDQISAVAAPDSVILRVTVTDPNPLEAQRLTQATAEVFRDYVSQLEGAGTPATSPIKANIVDAASLPTSPVAPQRLTTIGLGALLGLLIGLGAAWLRETLDTSIKSAAALEEITGAASLGSVIYDSSAVKRPLITNANTPAPRVESFRVLRTNLQFIDVDSSTKIFAITSPLEGDGKSCTAINIAITLAQAGQRTLLLEGDLRRPSIAGYLNLESAVGLTTLLSGQAELSDVIQPWGDTGLDVITSGRIPPNPAELLQSKAMKLLLQEFRTRYDIVIADAPAMLPVTDAALLAAEADGAIMVVRQGKTTKDQVVRAKQRLDSVGAALVGTVLNFARNHGAKEYGYVYAEQPGGKAPAPGPPPATPDFPAAPRQDGAEPARTSGVRQDSRFSGLGRIGSWAMLLAGILILTATAWLGWRTYQAYSHLSNASADVTRLQGEMQNLSAIDTAAAAADVAHLQAESTAARTAVDDPVFRAAGLLPWLGPNLDAVREVAVTVDTLSTDVMPSLVDVATTVHPAALAPKSGTINLAPIENASAALQSADVAVNTARQDLAGIDRAGVIAPIGDAVAALSRKLEEAALVTGTGARAARLLPPMLGASGPRTYLVVSQNPAEVRATGGMFGSYSVIRADRGTLTTVTGGTPTRSLGVFDPPITKLPASQVNLYTTRPAVFPADVNLSPDFPSAAKLYAAMYSKRTGKAVDGVIAVDPVALSYVLAGTGPVDAGNGVVLTSDTVVAVLLSTAYQQFAAGTDQAPRDAFLAKAAAAASGAVLAGHGDPAKTMSGLAMAADERRVLIWSADPAEQADLAQTELAGQLPLLSNVPIVGVFLNDGTGAKLDYYLHNKVAVSAGQCRSDGRRALDVTVTLHDTAPATGLPSYVTGTSAPGAAYLLRTNVSVFAPPGGGLVDVTQDGAPAGLTRGEERLSEVGIVGVTLKSGQSTSLHFRLIAPETSQPDTDILPELALTPGVNPWAVSVDSYRSCQLPGN